MVDRTQLTEARLDRLTRQILMYEALPKEKQHFDLVFDLAAKLLDFPTDEMVEAAAKVLYGRWPKPAGMLNTRAALEAVRQTMFGDTDG